jgi:hypothetical protein
MTMLHVRQPDISGFVPLASIAGLFRRTGAALGLLHQAIVSAKLRCAQRQLRFGTMTMNCSSPSTI